LALVVNSNPTAMNALGNLSRTQRGLSATFRNISSGQRVNRAADDAAGLGVAENLDSTARSAKVASRNINDGISVIQTYEGAANEISDILKRQRELAVQSSSETLADTERAYLHQEFSELHQEHKRIAATTNFNGLNLTDSSVAGGTVVGGGLTDPTFKTFDVQAGTNNSSNDRIQIRFDSLNVQDMENNWLGVTYGGGPVPDDQIVDFFNVDPDPVQAANSFNTAFAPGMPESLGVASVDQARASITALDFQLDYVNAARSKVGAVQNRLESAANNMETFTQNTLSAESQIRDADFAFETAEMSKFQVMQQAGVAILGQANGLSQGALRLI
jgi:flagellin